MMRSAIPFLVILLLTTVPGITDVPRTMSDQGILKDDGGTIVPMGITSSDSLSTMH